MNLQQLEYILAVDEVKKVCLRLDNLKYYYFAWGGRLITYY